eukprot:2301643-Lingulodinium_polyedra.AAC.1
MGVELAGRRRVCILQRVRKFAPGRAVAAVVLEDVDGSVARILRARWAEVFAPPRQCRARPLRR